MDKIMYINIKYSLENSQSYKEKNIKKNVKWKKSKSYTTQNYTVKQKKQIFKKLKSII